MNPLILLIPFFILSMLNFNVYSSSIVVHSYEELVSAIGNNTVITVDGVITYNSTLLIENIENLTIEGGVFNYTGVYSAIKIVNCRNIVIDGIALHSNYTGISIQYSKNITIRNSKLYGPSEWRPSGGIIYKNVSYLYIVGNEIAFFGHNGVVADYGSTQGSQHSEHIYVVDNYIHDNLDDGIDPSHDYHVIIRNNIILNNELIGVSLEYDCRDFIIQDNVIISNMNNSAGIKVEDSSDVIIKNNAIKTARSGILLSNAYNVSILWNSIDELYGVDSHGISLENNIVGVLSIERTTAFIYNTTINRAYLHDSGVTFSGVNIVTLYNDNSTIYIPAGYGDYTRSLVSETMLLIVGFSVFALVLKFIIRILR